MGIENEILLPHDLSIGQRWNLILLLVPFLILFLQLLFSSSTNTFSTLAALSFVPPPSNGHSLPPSLLFNVLLWYPTGLKLMNVFYLTLTSTEVRTLWQLNRCIFILLIVTLVLLKKGFTQSIKWLWEQEQCISNTTGKGTSVHKLYLIHHSWNLIKTIDFFKKKLPLLTVLQALMISGDTVGEKLGEPTGNLCSATLPSSLSTPLAWSLRWCYCHSRWNISFPSVEPFHEARWALINATVSINRMLFDIPCRKPEVYLNCIQ